MATDLPQTPATEASTRAEHPIWALYDSLRTARLNHKYYCCKLERLDRISTAFDVTLAAAAPTSAIAGLAFFKSPIGHDVWQYVTVLSALVAVPRPFLHLTRSIKELEGQVTGYRLIDFDLTQLAKQVELRRRFDDKMKAELDRIESRRRILVSRQPSARDNAKLITRCRLEVESELPHEKFYVPTPIGKETDT